MKPTEFKEQNIVFAKDQPEYQPLPAFKNNSFQGEVICCWKLSLWERMKVMITGRLWINLLTFNQPLTPYLLTVNKEDVLLSPKSMKRFSRKQYDKRKLPTLYFVEDYTINNSVFYAKGDEYPAYNWSYDRMVGLIKLGVLGESGIE